MVLSSFAPCSKPGARNHKEDLSALRRYETIFILRPDQGEPQIKEAIKRYESFVTQGGGELIETEEWGIRELAYRIKGERRGYYVRLDYVSDGAVMNEVERNLKLADNILRYLSVMLEADSDPARAREEIDARNRRLAEAKAAAEARAAAFAAEREKSRDEEVLDDAESDVQMEEPEGGGQPD
jgi:small subunit ribosomal protein S6